MHEWVKKSFITVMTPADPSCHPAAPSLHLRPQEAAHCISFKSIAVAAEPKPPDHRSSHLGQSLIHLLRGAAVRLGHVAEGEGHVLQGEVAGK